jgi:predicted TIM-barrel fold metal-dependent hydrolase
MADLGFPPPGSCDSHVHVIGPKQRFPLSPQRSYTPADAPADDLAATLRRLGLSRVVLVQPSFYGTDNSCMLDAMARWPGARGVAVLDDSAGEDALDALDEAGVRGLRVNVATAGTVTVEEVQARLRSTARLCEHYGWHVQMFVPAAMIAPLAPMLRTLPVAVVIDHFGLVSPDGDAEALRVLTALLETGHVWVKISGAYRIAEDPNDPRIGPLARTLCAANPERIVWGSDWPHTPSHAQRTGAADEEIPFQAIDPAGLLALVPRWLGDDALVRRVLVTNPQRLYGFD